MISRSLRDSLILDMVVQLPQERLVLRLPPAEPVDADLVPIQSFPGFGDSSGGSGQAARN